MQIVRIAWQGVVGFPIRTLLSCLSLVVGITGIVSVYSASATVEATVIQTALLTGGPIATVKVDGLNGASALDASKEVRDQLVSYFGPDTRAATTAHLGTTLVRVGENARDVEVVFTEEHLRALRPFPVLSGFWIDDALPLLVPQFVVNGTMAGDYSAGVGSDVAIGTGTSDLVRAKVTGVIEDGSPVPTAYVSLQDMDDFLRVNGDDLALSLEITGPTVSGQTVQRRLSEIDSYSDRNNMWQAQRIDTIEALSAEVNATRASFLAVGALGLLATVFAIANVGLSSIRERSIELSIRRALGARRRSIPLIMVVESQIIALIAGAIAVPSSALFYSMIGSLFGAPFGITPPSYPWIYALVGVGIGMATSLIGSLAPALRAIRIPIAAVMRE